MPEPQESTAPTAVAAPGVVLTGEQLSNLLTTVIEEARKPVVDKESQARREAQRLRLRKVLLEEKEAERRRQDNCSHLREDNTSCIAWQVNTDGVTRGFCPHCTLVIDEHYKDREKLLKIPILVVLVRSPTPPPQEPLHLALCWK